MKGDPKAIEFLQAQLKNELTAINQYFLHYRMLKHWGLDKLQDLGKLMIGEDVPELLNCDLTLERAAQATVKDGIEHCEKVRDYVSRDLLQTILDDTEEHIDFLETQIELIGKVGVQNYLQSQMGELET